MKKIFLYLMIGISSISYAQTVDSQASSPTTNEKKNSIKKGTWTVELSSGFPRHFQFSIICPSSLSQNILLT